MQDNTNKNQETSGREIKELWTVRRQAAFNRLTNDGFKKLKPVKLLELGENERGKFARIEFDDESARPLYLETLEDACHPFLGTMDSSEQMAIAEFFKATEPVELPNGDKKSFGMLSFSSVTRSKRGKWVSTCGFDNEPKPHHEGWLQGLEFAREYMTVKKCDVRGVLLAHIIQDLAKAMDDCKGVGMKKRSHAAYAFVHTLDSLLGFAAQKANFNEFIDGKILETKEAWKFFEEREQQQKAEFVARMKSSKKEKRSKSEDSLCQEVAA